MQHCLHVYRGHRGTLWTTDQDPAALLMGDDCTVSMTCWWSGDGCARARLRNSCFLCSCLLCVASMHAGLAVWQKALACIRGSPSEAWQLSHCHTECRLDLDVLPVCVCREIMFMICVASRVM
jgi:diadenosine tetraphosphatase ApaH/serine/threonine PP2A family protein phosphatase